MIIKTVALRCDSCGGLSSQRGFETTTLARVAARKEGWERVGSKDRCFRCRPRE